MFSGQIVVQITFTFLGCFRCVWGWGSIKDDEKVLGKKFQNFWMRNEDCRDREQKWIRTPDTGRVRISLQVTRVVSTQRLPKNPIFCLDTGRVIHALGDTGRVTQKTEFWRFSLIGYLRGFYPFSTHNRPPGDLEAIFLEDYHWDHLGNIGKHCWFQFVRLITMFFITSRFEIVDLAMLG